MFNPSLNISVPLIWWCLSRCILFVHVLFFRCRCASCKLPIKGAGGDGCRGYLNRRNPVKMCDLFFLFQTTNYSEFRFLYLNLIMERGKEQEIKMLCLGLNSRQGVCMSLSVIELLPTAPQYLMRN